MNSAVVILCVGLIFTIAYRLYARKVENIWQIEPKRPTAAVSKFDGVDYVPAKNWLVLFGHHFASIAGAGPIIGPIIGVTLWGWGPVMIWVVLGSIFIGGIHDFGTLIISMREDGIILGVIGILISHPNMNGPAFISVESPIGFLWPMMFITVACGANSGFHSLISSGITSKQIVSESHAKRIGFGGMLMEGFLAAIVVIVII